MQFLVVPACELYIAIKISYLESVTLYYNNIRGMIFMVRIVL
jgi:hypothetical protein